MCYETTEKFDLNQHRINHLADRLDSLRYDKTNELLVKYGMTDDDAPVTLEQFIKRIQDGKFKVPEDKLDKNWYYNLGNTFRWRDPSVKEDEEGYKKAYAILRKAFLETTDIINIKDADEGLKAVQEFEKRKFN